MHPLADKCFSEIPKDGPVIVAVSGGSDSMALLLLANIWAQKNDVYLQAVTIDHGLRPEAAAEAGFVAGVCAGLEIDHVTLAWEGTKPTIGIQQAARNSRYALLDQLAQEIGSYVILAGHTLDDQAETVFMRNQRHKENSIGHGISGMARRTDLISGTHIFRPLLGLSRLTLRDVLKEFSQSFVEDTSNIDESYERVRVRNYLDKNPDVAVRYLTFSHLCGRFRQACAEQTCEYLFKNVTVKPGHLFEINRSLLFASKRSFHPVVLQAIQTMIAVAGGQEYVVPRHKIQNLMESLFGDGNMRATLGGAVIEAVKSSLRIYREARNIQSILVGPHEVGIWDGRLLVQNDSPQTLFVESAKPELLKEFEQLNGSQLHVKPKSVLRSTPIIHVQSNGTVSNQIETPYLPMIEPAKLPDGIGIRLVAPALEHFCSQYDEALKYWVRSLDQLSCPTIAPEK